MRQTTSGTNIIRTSVILSDWIILNVLLGIFINYIPSITPYYFTAATKISVLATNMAFGIAQYFFFTIIHVRQIHFDQVLHRVLKLSITQLILTFTFLQFLCPSESFLSFSIIFFCTYFFVIMCSRYVEKDVLKHYRALGRNTRRVLFVGCDPSILELYNYMISDPSIGYRVAGYFSDKEIKGAPAEFKHLGSRHDLIERVRHYMDYTAKSGNAISNNNVTKDTIILPNCEEMFVSLSHDYTDEIVTLMRFCDKNIIHFYYVPRLFGNYKLNLTPEHVGEMDLFTNHIEPLQSMGNRFIKRSFDIILSLLAITIITPFVPIISFMIHLQSAGPIFFFQERTGLNGANFNMMKFRSMHISSDADKKQATKNDPRKFSFGDFMRKTNIDEFPQFINVLLGDMSIVGPRPHMIYHTTTYSQLIDKYMVRHFCKPGITGWAQVTGCRGETKEIWQMEERIKRDIWYIENWTPWLDIKIIILTAKSIIIPDKHAY